MASRYWVGGGSSTNWAATTPTNWSATDGGAGNETVPGSTDDVFFTANSTGTANISASISVQSVDCTGFAGTWTQANSTTLTITGTLFKLVAGMTFAPNASSRVIAFTPGAAANCLVTTGGKVLSSITINDGGAGGTVTLQDTLTMNGTTSGVFTLTAGTFNANNQNLTLSTFTASNSNTRTLTMGSGTWTLTGEVGIWTLTTITGLTFNKDTSTIVIATAPDQQARTFAAGAPTGGYNIVTVNANTQSAPLGFSGAATFATFNISGPNWLVLTSGVTLTVTNAFTWTGTTTALIGMESSGTGQATISVASGSPTVAYGAFRNMAFTGGATFTANNSFSLGNNSGITINAPAAGGNTARVIGG